MVYPAGVQTSTLTFSNPITFLGNEATRTELTVQPTAGVVWTATGMPIDDFAEVVNPGAGMPGSLTAPFVDQEGFTDGAGNAFTMWAYVVTRKTFFGSSSKTVKKAWAPVIGQSTVDFDNLPGGSVGLPVSAPPVPVTSVAGLAGVVGAESLAGELVEFLPDGVTPEVVDAALALKLDVDTAGTTYAAKSVETSKLDADQKGAVSGVAPLDAAQLVPQANLPEHLTVAAQNATIDDKIGEADPARRAKLRRFWAALATGSCNVIIPGDSWTEGTRGADLPNLRYVDQLINAIRAASPTPIGGTYVPAWTTYPTRMPANWVYTGVTEEGAASVTGKKETSGMGYYNREIPVGATAALTFNGTGFRMHMDRRPDGATVEVRVDGVLVTTYDTFLATLSTSESRDYLGYAPGPHTLHLTVIAGSGTVFSLQGAYVFNGDETNGVRIYPAGRGGITAKIFLTDYPFAGQLSAVVPDLVIFALGGINDWRTGISAAQFETALRDGVQDIHDRPLMADASLVFIKFPQTQSAGTPVSTWQEYRDKVDLVAGDVGGLVVDLEPIFGAGELDDASALVNTDKVHPDDPGHLAIATTIAQAILPPTPKAKAGREQIWLDVSKFWAVLGAPVVGLVNSTYWSWRLDATTDSGVIAQITTPQGWASCDVDLWFMNYSTGTGNIRFRTRIKKVALGAGVTVANNEDKTATAKAQFIQDRIYKYHTSPVTIDSETSTYVEVTRRGTDALDTLANDVVFIGAMIRRTS